jgi:hypothetical protein
MLFRKENNCSRKIVRKQILYNEEEFSQVVDLLHLPFLLLLLLLTQLCLARMKIYLVYFEA